MIRQTKRPSAESKTKKDVVQSRAISRTTLVVGATVAILVAFLTFGAPDALGEAAEEVVDAVTTEQPAKIDQAVLKKLYNKSGKYKRQAHFWAHKRGAGHRYHRPLSPMRQSIPYEQYRLHMWQDVSRKEYLAWKKWNKARILEARKWNRANRDFNYALKLAAKHYGVSYSWLHACAHSEGHIHGRRPGIAGIDPFIMNHSGSGAGGWMQFMESTFYGNVDNARGFPRKYAKWKSKVGQAFTAAYMFKIGQSRQWTGSGCN